MGAEIDRLEVIIEAQASRANKQLDELYSKLNKVSGILRSMNTKGLQNVANVLSRTGKAASNSASGTKNFTSGIKTLSVNAASANNGLKNVTSTIGKYLFKVGSAENQTRSLSQILGSFNATFYPVIRGFKKLGSAIESSMNYIETFNYFSVTMDKIGQEFSDQYEKYGYSSAEAYAESFSGRLNELTKKMSGFSVGSDGVLSLTSDMNLGLDPEQLMNYQANISAITNSVGLIGENSVNASKALSMLAADMSSFKNIDLSTVMTNFKSGMIGQSRALYKYGIDITNATLQTYAYKYGLTTAVSEMTQADKMQLRLLAILDQSKVAWSDQANTINSVANQYRILKQQVSNVARMIGNLLMPVIQAVLPVVNALLIAIQRLITFVGGLFGIDASKIMDGISSGYGSGLDDLVDDTEDVSDGLDSANDKAKKLQRTLLGFDQINKLNDDSDSSSSSDAAGVGGIDLSNEIAAALTDYEAVWNKAFENSVNKAQEYADKISSVFGNMWETIKKQDYEGLGAYIAGGVDYIFEKINSVFNWEIMGPKITAFVDGYCQTVNSLASNIHWDKIGQTIGDGSNVVIGSLYLYFAQIDWVSLGKSFSDGVEGIVNSVDWKLLGRTIGSWLMKIPKIVYGFVSDLDWAAVGEAFGNAINGIFLEFDGETIAGGINGLVNGIITALKAAIKTVEWDEVAETVGDVLGNLDWGVLAKVGLTLAAVKLASSFGSILTAAFSDKIKSVFGNALGNAAGKTSSVFGGLIKQFKSGGAIYEAIGGLGINLSIFAESLTGISIPIGASMAAIVVAIAAVVAGIIDLWNTSESFRTNVSNMLDIIAKAFQDAKARIWDNGLKPLWESIKDLFGSLYDLYESSGLKKIFELVVTGIGYLGSVAFAALIEGVTLVFEKICGVAEGIVKIVNGFVDVIDWFCDLVFGGWDGIQGAFEDASEWIGGIFATDWSDYFGVFGVTMNEFLRSAKGVFAGIKKIFSGLIDFVAGIFSGDWSRAWTGIKNIFGGIWDGIVAVVKRPINTLLGVFESAINGIIRGFNWMKKILNNFHFDVPDWVPKIGGESIGFSLPMSSEITLPRFENGGFPNTGEMFLARENGITEMVGRIGTRPAVANNDQIVAGIENAVRNAISDVMADMIMAMRSQGSSGDVVNEIIIQVDSETAYRIVKKGKEKSDRRYHTVVPVG